MEPVKAIDLETTGEAAAGLPVEARPIYLRLRLVAQLLRYAPGAEGACLLWRDADGVTQSRRIEGSVLIGRDETCNIVLTSPTVSRRHCRVAERLGEVWLEDLGSTHGTQVNGKQRKEVRLVDGDLIELGGMVLAFILPDDQV